MLVIALVLVQPSLYSPSYMYSVSQGKQNTPSSDSRKTSDGKAVGTIRSPATFTESVPRTWPHPKLSPCPLNCRARCGNTLSFTTVYLAHCNATTYWFLLLDTD
jgi:hypothetical protein